MLTKGVHFILRWTLFFMRPLNRVQYPQLSPHTALQQVWIAISPTSKFSADSL